MTESRVAFQKREVYVGRDAVGKANHIYDLKRMIGLDWGDKSLSEFVKKWPFEVIESAEGTYNI